MLGIKKENRLPWEIFVEKRTLEMSLRGIFTEANFAYKTTRSNQSLQAEYINTCNRDVEDSTSNPRQNIYANVTRIARVILVKIPMQMC